MHYKPGSEISGSPFARDYYISEWANSFMRMSESDSESDLEFSEEGDFEHL